MAGQACGLVDDIIPEPKGGAHRDPDTTAKNLEAFLKDKLAELTKIPIDELLEKRYARLRKIGRYQEGALENVES